MKAFDFFKRLGRQEKAISNEMGQNLPINLHPQILEIFEQKGGSSLLNKAFWFHSQPSALHWKSLLSDMFPAAPEMIPIGYDWLGSQFAVSADGERMGLYDILDCEFNELPFGIDKFLTEFLVTGTDGFFSKKLFHEVSQILGTLQFGQNYGVIKPLFLGGEESVSNFSIEDMEVSWDITMQIYNQVKDLPEGTIIEGIDFE